MIFIQRIITAFYYLPVNVHQICSLNIFTAVLSALTQKDATIKGMDIRVKLYYTLQIKEAHREQDYTDLDLH